MCEHGDSIDLEVTVPAWLSHTGSSYRKVVGIDRCIAPLVKALNDGGIETSQSCCGHGKGPGEVMLSDGSVLLWLKRAEQEADTQRGRELIDAIEGQNAERVGHILRGAHLL